MASILCVHHVADSINLRLYEGCDGAHFREEKIAGRQGRIEKSQRRRGGKELA